MIFFIQNFVFSLTLIKVAIEAMKLEKEEDDISIDEDSIGD